MSRAREDMTGRAPEGTVFIRTMHPYGFRSREWARLVTVMTDPEHERDCYLVWFPDGATDHWVCDDPDGQYEFDDAGHRRG